jgi:cyanophycinase
MADNKYENRNEYKTKKENRAKPKGTLIVIGGHEDKEGDRLILQEVCKPVLAGKGKLVLVTAATQLPEEVATDYRDVFVELGVGVEQFEVLDIRDRGEALSEEKFHILDEAAVVFMTGGSQLRITSQFGNTPVYDRIVEFYHNGGIVAGTSAGAAALPETMLVSGPSDESNRLFTLGMAPGLGLIKDVVIDSHFAQRGRIGRLLGAVAQNPRILGIGIDEDTAIVVTSDNLFRVVGGGAVYITDGSPISYSSLSESTGSERVISLHDVRLHVLSDGSCFDLTQRRPLVPDEVK